MGVPSTSLAFFGPIGTVNSIGGRLLSEFAIDLGLSPVRDVLAEDQTRAAFRVQARKRSRPRAKTIEPVAWRLGLDEARRAGEETETWADLVGKSSRLPGKTASLQSLRRLPQALGPAPSVLVPAGRQRIKGQAALTVDAARARCQAPQGNLTFGRTFKAAVVATHPF